MSDPKRHDGDWGVFRRAKLMLHSIDPALVVAAAEGTLVATVALTDEKGGPRCAQVRRDDGVVEVIEAD